MAGWIKAGAARYVKQTHLPGGEPVLFCVTPVDPRRPEVSYWEAYATVDGRSTLVVRDVTAHHVIDQCDRATGELT